MNPASDHINATWLALLRDYQVGYTGLQPTEENPTMKPEPQRTPTAPPFFAALAEARQYMLAHLVPIARATDRDDVPCFNKCPHLGSDGAAGGLDAAEPVVGSFVDCQFVHCLPSFVDESVPSLRLPRLPRLLLPANATPNPAATRDSRQRLAMSALPIRGTPEHA